MAVLVRAAQCLWLGMDGFGRRRRVGVMITLDRLDVSRTSVDADLHWSGDPLRRSLDDVWSASGWLEHDGVRFGVGRGSTSGNRGEIGGEPGTDIMADATLWPRAVVSSTMTLGARIDASCAFHSHEVSMTTRVAEAAMDAPFEAMLAPYYDGFVRRLAFIVGDPDEARDLAQAEYLRAFEAWARFDGADARAWLYTIGINLAISERRR